MRMVKPAVGHLRQTSAQSTLRPPAGEAGAAAGAGGGGGGGAAAAGEGDGGRDIEPPAKRTKQQETQKQQVGNSPRQGATTFTIYVKEVSKGRQLQFRVSERTTVEAVFNAVKDAWGVKSSEYYIKFDGQRLGGDTTMRDLSVEDGEIFYLFKKQVGC